MSQAPQQSAAPDVQMPLSPHFGVILKNVRWYSKR